jgi:hypothetical protein
MLAAKPRVKVRLRSVATDLRELIFNTVVNDVNFDLILMLVFMIFLIGNILIVMM